MTKQNSFLKEPFIGRNLPLHSLSRKPRFRSSYCIVKLLHENQVCTFSLKTSLTKIFTEHQETVTFSNNHCELWWINTTLEHLEPSHNFCTLLACRTVGVLQFSWFAKDKTHQLLLLDVWCRNSLFKQVHAQLKKKKAK